MPSSNSSRPRTSPSTCRPASAPRPAGFTVPRKRVQLVEVHLAEIVDGLSVDGEEQPGRADARSLAVRAGVLHHHLVEPRLHPRVRLAALPVPAVMPLDAPRDPVKADLLAFRVLALDLRLRRHPHHEFLAVEPVQDRVPHGLRQLLPRRFERESQRLRQAVHHPPVPRVGVVLERLAHEAAAQDAAPRIGNQQLRMRELVDPEAAAGPAGALRIVEHEVLGLDVAVDKVMRLAAQAAVEALRLRLRRAFHHLHLHQAVAHQQRGGDPRLDRLFVLAADHEAVHHRVHVADLRFVQLDLAPRCPPACRR